MTHDRACRALAVHFLRDYRLTGPEREEEIERLAQAIQQTAETELENLEHRRIA